MEKSYSIASNNSINKACLIPTKELDHDDVSMLLDPIWFVENILHVKLDDQQADVLRGLDEHDNVSVRSGRGAGKTFVAACCVWWFMCTHENAQVYVTAPSGQTALKALWPAIAFIYSQMDPYFKALFEVQNNEIKHVDPDLAKIWFCSVRVARPENPGALAGNHAPNMLYIVDEASDVSDRVVTVIKGSLTQENNKFLMLSNPRKLSGKFYESQQPEAKDQYVQLHMDCFRSSHISNRKLQDLITEVGGEGTDGYSIEVLGEFPKSEVKTIIAGEDIDRAVEYSISDEELNEPGNEVPIIWGIDMSMGNDKSVLVRRQGKKVHPDIKKWQERDTMIVVGYVTEIYNNTPDEQKPVKIFVDSIGIGKGAYDRLKENQLPVIAAIANNRALKQKYIFNQKSEWWSEMSAWFKGDVDLPNDPDLVKQLKAMQTRISSDGRFASEKKPDYIKRFDKSPDEADALAQTFCLKSTLVANVWF